MFFGDAIAFQVPIQRVPEQSLKFRKLAPMFHHSDFAPSSPFNAARAPRPRRDISWAVAVRKTPAAGRSLEKLDIARRSTKNML